MHEAFFALFKKTTNSYLLICSTEPQSFAIFWDQIDSDQFRISMHLCFFLLFFIIWQFDWRKYRVKICAHTFHLIIAFSVAQWIQIWLLEGKQIVKIAFCCKCIYSGNSLENNQNSRTQSNLLFRLVLIFFLSNLLLLIANFVRDLDSWLYKLDFKICITRNNLDTVFALKIVHYCCMNKLFGCLAMDNIR